MPFADELINERTAQALTRAVHTVIPGAEPAVLRAAAGQLGPLALRERADLLRDALLADVPGDYAEPARVVRAARDGAPEFGGWLIWTPVGNRSRVRQIAVMGR
ncbi:hypothetical protein [Streptomyces brasiliensis]|uniref:Uncharacterized protein n=1 Tax=Streptomyces brasiliensis TaxID=1954 RepID=A0A917NTI7_9ACTN|nr:hypothetical protein [Streptomyces brasiliensis]GGJ27081.1 hypothetical protein GCM10010121_042850 [Streptomyces brasiliensis]